MEEEPDDSPTLGEQMNSALYLDPGFTADKPRLVEALRRDIDETAKRAQANLDQQRANAADVEAIAKDIARQAASKELPDQLQRGDQFRDAPGLRDRAARRVRRIAVEDLAERADGSRRALGERRDERAGLRRIVVAR